MFSCFVCSTMEFEAMDLREIIRRNYGYILDNLQADAVVPILVEKGVLDLNDDQQIEAKAVEREKSRKLLALLDKKGPNGRQRFLEALALTQPFIRDRLLGMCVCVCVCKCVSDKHMRLRDH